MIILGIVLFLTVLEAVHEGLKNRTKHQLSGIIEAFKLTGIYALVPILLLLTAYDGYFNYRGPVLAFWTDFIPMYIVGTIALRYAIFDYVYNLAAGNPLEYVGSTKWSDKNIMQKINMMWGPSFFRWTRFIALLLGISLLLQI